MGKGEAKCRRRAGRGEGGERRDTDGGVADGHGGHAGSGAGVVSSVGWERGYSRQWWWILRVSAKTSNEINTISIRPRGKSLEPHSYFSHVLSGFFTEFFTFFFCFFFVSY